MIYTRSPYYVDIDATSITNAIRYEMRLYVWKGSFSTPPTMPTYVFENNLYNKQASVNISNYINDYLSDTYLVNIIGTDTQDFDDIVNVKWEVDIITNAGRVVNFITLSEVATKGYNIYQDGRNGVDFITENILSDGNNLKVYNKILVPINNYGGTVFSVRAVSYPSETVLLDKFVPIPTTPAGFLQEVQVDNFVAGDKYIIITARGSDSITYYIEKECKYKPINVQFKNRYGANELICFFRKNTETVNINKQNFERKSYARQLYNFNTNGNKEITLVSGYQNETFNKVIEQLLLSEDVYLEIDNKWVPYNVKSDKLTYKTKVNDKLISYEITFEQAFNLINNV